VPLSRCFAGRNLAPVCSSVLQVFQAVHDFLTKLAGPEQLSEMAQIHPRAQVEG